jgi:hypothetical protein
MQEIVQPYDRGVRFRLFEVNHSRLSHLFQAEAHEGELGVETL